MTPEGRIVAAIRRELTKRDIWNAKVHGSLMQQRGLPDVIGCWEGRFLALEVKVPGEKPTPLQTLTLHEIAESGGIAAVVWSVGDVDYVLREAALSIRSQQGTLIACCPDHPGIPR